ncbi:MAG: SPOR domain-containing protein [Phenylobacterium sp.]
MPAALALSLAAVLTAGASPASAQTVPVSYPPSRALSDITAWLQRDTPITPGQVVDISPSAVTAITGAQPTGQPRGFLAAISSEALDPQILSHEGIASWSIPVEIDCDKRSVRLGMMTGFTGRDLKNDPKTVREADASWVTPTAAAPLGAVIRALCDRDFRRPLVGKVKAGATAKTPEPVKAPPEAPIQAAQAAPPPESRAPKAVPALRSTLPPSRTPAAAPATSKAPAGGGSIAVQIGASPSKPDIEALLAKAKKKFAGDMGGLNGTVATVQVDGKTVNRALISGFASNTEANDFCKKLAAEGQACFIRR